MVEEQKDDTTLYDIILSVKNVFRQMWNRKWVIISLSLVFASLSFFYFKINKKPVQYIATSTFMLYDSDKGISSLSSVLGVNSAGGTSNKDLIIYILGSRRIIENMLLTKTTFQNTDDLILNHFARITGLDVKWREHPILNDYKFRKHPEASRVDFQDSIIGVLVDMISKQETFDIDIKSWKMSFTFKNENEHFAKLVVEEQIKSLCDFYISRKKVKGVETVDFLQNKRDSLSIALRSAEYDFAAWKDSNQRLIKSAGAADEAKFKQDIGMLTSSYLESSRQLEMAKLTLLDESPIVQAIDTPKYPLPRATSSNWKLISVIVSLVGFVLITIIVTGQKFFSDFLKKQKEAFLSKKP